MPSGPVLGRILLTLMVISALVQIFFLIRG
jgi:hypothetical protein